MPPLQLALLLFYSLATVHVQGYNFLSTQGNCNRGLPFVMDPSFHELLKRLDHLSEQFQELKDGVQKAVLVADQDPEMALTRARKVLEHVVREVYNKNDLGLLESQVGVVVATHEALTSRKATDTSETPPKSAVNKNPASVYRPGQIGHDGHV
jgi:hypothetical protein